MKKIVYCVFFISSSLLVALDVPPLTKAVNDYANVLDSSQQEELEKYLRKVDKSSKLQVALLTIPSLEGEALESYSIRVVEKWKLGDAERDSGVLLLVAKEDKKLRIEVGYGLEKDLTDAISSKIISSIIAPSFKQGDYYNGIKNGLKAIVAYSLKDESLIKESEAKADEDERSSLWYIFVGVAILFIAGLNSRFLGGRKGRFGSYRRTGIFSHKNNSWNNSFSGKGGKFGGGGASGRW